MNAQNSLIILADLPNSAADDLIVQHALDGSVWVLDAGNSFNPYRIVRQIRRQTSQMDSILGQIQVARAFTCFQVVSLLEQTQISSASVFILRLLTTFADEMIPLGDRLYLLRRVDAQLDRLQRSTSVTVTLEPARIESDPIKAWCSHLQARAGQVFFPKRAAGHHLPTLF